VAVEAAGSLRTIVGVVFFVAGETAGLRLDLEDRFDVAGLAFDKFVRTIQRMVRVDVVVEMNRCPCVGGMAGFAGAAEVTVMVVVFEVTRYARDVHLVVERILTVAVVASVQSVGEWQFPHSCPLRPSWASSSAWQSKHTVGAPTKVWSS
jgi:hypothetical protein